MPSAWLPRVVAATGELVSEPALHRRRVALVHPVYQVKWACILLNSLLPVAADRRRLASEAVAPPPYEQVATLLAEVSHA